MPAKTYTWASPLGELIVAFVAEKRALGYIYVSDELTLNRLDRYLVKQKLYEPKLEKELLLGFLEQNPEEKPSARSRRMTAANQFAEYLVRNGYEAYIIPRKMYPAYDSSFKARILTRDEISRFLAAANRFPQDDAYPLKHHEISLLFHLLLNCGLRISDAVNLRMKDVDLEAGVLHVIDGKNHVDRLVPMSDFMLARCRQYCEICRSDAGKDDYFFPGTKRPHLTAGTAYAYFRKVLWMAGISHGGRAQGGGPRLHDLRHTFAVNCLNEWVSSGVDLSTALPVLAKYMGHVSISGTQKYLKFTAEMYPETIARLEERFGSVIPEVGGVDEAY